jgi:hypothetical protein
LLCPTVIAVTGVAELKADPLNRQKRSFESGREPQSRFKILFLHEKTFGIVNAFLKADLDIIQRHILKGYSGEPR